MPLGASQAQAAQVGGAAGTAVCPGRGAGGRAGGRAGGQAGQRSCGCLALLEGPCLRVNMHLEGKELGAAAGAAFPLNCW